MRMDPRQDTVFSTQDEKVHADLKAKEAGGVSRIDTVNIPSNAKVVSTMVEISILWSQISTRASSTWCN